jgi:CelD/BcsL family acetyltransferase involved in cellulose biosynthesis
MGTSSGRARHASTVGAGSFAVEVTTLGELDPSDIERWRVLDERAIDPHPYISADYLAAGVADWAKARDIRLILVRRDEDLVVVMPFTIASLHPGIPLRVLTSADPVLADETGRSYPLVDRACGAEALSAVFASLRALRLPRLVEFAAVPADGTIFLTISAALGGPRRQRERGRAGLPFTRLPGVIPPGGDRVDVIPHHRSASSRRQARQRLNALERHYGGQLRVVDRSSDPYFAGEFLTFQAAGWKGDAQRHGLAYRLTGRDEWFARTAERFRRSGGLRAVELRVGERTVYMSAALRVGQTLFGWQDAYDESSAVRGTGELARSAFVNWAAAQDFGAFDPNMSWSYVEAARNFPDRRDLVRILAAASAGYPVLVLGLFAALLRCRETVRAVRRRVSDTAGRLRGPGDENK